MGKKTEGKSNDNSRSSKYLKPYFVKSKGVDDKINVKISMSQIVTDLIENSYDKVIVKL